MTPPNDGADFDVMIEEMLTLMKKNAIARAHFVMKRDNITVHQYMDRVCQIGIDAGDSVHLIEATRQMMVDTLIAPELN